MTDLLRPSHYNAYHRIEAGASRRQRRSTRRRRRARCARAATSSRSIARSTTSQPGELLAVHTAGAYGYAWRRTTTRGRGRRGARRRRSVRRHDRARGVRGPRAPRAPRARVEDRLMLRRLLADTHDRLPAIAELLERDAGRGASAWSCTRATTARRSRSRRFSSMNMPLAGVFGRNDGDHEGLQGVRRDGRRHRAVRVAAQLRGRRAAHPARARHRRRRPRARSRRTRSSCTASRTSRR